jgi:hypothetical protein
MLISSLEKKKRNVIQKKKKRWFNLKGKGDVVE